MKIKAEIEWLVNDYYYGVSRGKNETVDVDMDYVESDEGDIAEWIENEIAEKHGRAFKCSRNDDDGDFVVANMDELVEDVKFDEFQNAVQYC